MLSKRIPCVFGFVICISLSSFFWVSICVCLLGLCCYTRKVHKTKLSTKKEKKLIQNQICEATGNSLHNKAMWGSIALRKKLIMTSYLFLYVCLRVTNLYMTSIISIRLLIGYWFLESQTHLMWLTWPEPCRSSPSLSWRCPRAAGPPLQPAWHSGRCSVMFKRRMDKAWPSITTYIF